MRTFSRIAAAAVAALLATAAAEAAPKKVPLTRHAVAPSPASMPIDMSLGDPKAPVQVTEYASLSCPHCARFDREVFPQLKAKYIDNGLVHYTMREILTEPRDVAAAGFLLARCAGPAHYFDVVHQVFASQPQWESGDIPQIFRKIGQANGVSPARFDACLSDQKAREALNARVELAGMSGISSVPTVLVNGKKVESSRELTVADIDAAIAAARKK